MATSPDQPTKKSSQETPQETPKAVPAQNKYVVPEKEQGIFHVEYEPRSGRFDTETGRKRHKPFIQKFHPRDFALQISMNDRGEPVFATIGWRINKILHVPAAQYLDGVVVNISKVVGDKGSQTTKIEKVPIADALKIIEGIIKAQDAEAKQ